MELKIYLRILLSKWWIVVPVFLVTLTATIVFTFSRVPVYSSTATFVVAPNAAFEDVRSFASGLDILSRRTEIASTYAEVAGSRLIKQKALESLDIPSTEELVVEGKLRAGTNVIEIAVEGNNPALVRDIANVVGTETMMYAQDLYETYILKQLDEASLPSAPVRPNKLLNLGLGLAGGIILGVGLAFLSVYLEAPLEDFNTFNVLDRETGAYNKRYFEQRLGEEMARAKRNKNSLSLALLNVDRFDAIDSYSYARRDALRQVARVLRQYVREEDIIARIEGTVFAFLFPDVLEGSAKAMVAEIEIRLGWVPLEIEKSGVKININLDSASAVLPYQPDIATPDAWLLEALVALQQAEARSNGKIEVLQPLASADK